MELDEHGLPRPADFRPPRAAPAVTKARLAALAAAIALSVLIAVGIGYAPELERLLAPRGRGMDPRIAQALNAGQQAVDRQDWPRALAAWNRLAALMPKSSEPHVLRSESLARMKRYREAAEACADGLRLRPRDPMLLNNRAYFRALARIDLREALADAEKAVAAAPHSSYFDTRGYLRYLLGDFPGARADFDEALRRLESGDEGRGAHEASGEIHFHRGLLRKAMGDRAGMKADYEAARQRGFQWTEEPPPMPAVPGRDVT